MRIIIADDHAFLRQGVERILRKEFPTAEIDEVADGEDLVKKVMQYQYDLVISDVSMPGRGGMEALHAIKEQYPKLPVLMLSMYPEDHYALRALKAGASGYLSKSMAPEELITAVRRVLMGRKYITASVAELLTDQFSEPEGKLPHETLSDREFEVLKLLATGMGLSDIGKTLFISATTVSTYRTRILEKMNLKTNADLIRYALENGLF